MQVVSSQFYIQLNQYIDHLQRTKGSSLNTVQAYRRDIEKFFEYAQHHDVDSFISVTEEDIEEYKAFLVSNGLSASSVSRSLSSLRGLFQFLLSRGMIEKNPAKAIHSEKVVQKELNILCENL